MQFRSLYRGLFHLIVFILITDHCEQVCRLRGADKRDRSAQPRHEHTGLSTGLGTLMAWI